MSIGAMVTLRSDKAYEFLDRLISTALPRYATSAAFRQRVLTARQLHARPADQLIFPEIDYSKVES